MQAIRVSMLSLVLFFSAVASGTPIVWTLQDVTLTDGQSLVGSFTYDVSTARLSNISVVNSGTAAIPSAVWNTEYLTQFPSQPGSEARAAFFMAGPASQTTKVLFLLWNQNGQRLNDAGGVVALLPFGPPTAPNNSVFTTCGTFLDPTAEFPTFVELPTCENADVLHGTGAPYITGGTLTAVPIPATAWLLAAAWCSLGMFRGRRKPIETK